MTSLPATSLLIALLFIPFSSMADVNPEASDQKARPFVPRSENAPMTASRIGELIKRLDEKAEKSEGRWFFNIEGTELIMMLDERADRMRIMSPIIQSKEIPKDQLYRMMQANFDTALDARYAVAKDHLWSVFLHPLRSLTDADFVSGVGQVINLSDSFGKSYSSGVLIFRGGDSHDIKRRDLIDRLLRKGLSI
jgi:hypothetical protein